MPKLLDIFVSVVTIGETRDDPSDRLAKLQKLLASRYANYEIVLIDNGLDAAALQSVRSILADVPCIRLIRLAKSVSVDTAMFAGVEASIGDYVCTLYGPDPLDVVPEFIAKNQEYDAVFGVADNLTRSSLIAALGSKLYYWYNRRYLKIDFPKGSTWFMAVNRNMANAITRGNQTIRHFRHVAKTVGFNSTNLEYSLRKASGPYTKESFFEQSFRAIDTIASYSSHPLRAISYAGLIVSIFNVIYAIYVLAISLSQDDVAAGWTTLSLQASGMFFFLFAILAILAEYIGRILLETRKEPPYHIMQEFDSAVPLADETRRNVTL